MSCEFFAFIFMLTLKLFYFYSTGEEIFSAFFKTLKKFISFLVPKNFFFISFFRYYLITQQLLCFQNSFFYFKNALKL